MIDIKCEGGGSLDTRRRTLVKATVWQFIGLMVMSLIGWIFTGSMLRSSAMAVTGTICGFLIYFIYERIWSQVRWGQVYRIDD